MSKSLGNGIDPLEIIDEYGADSLRYSLTSGVAPGGDIRLSEEKTEAGRNFMNKIWNASRYVIMNLGEETLPDISTVELTLADKWILTNLTETTREVRKNLEKYEYGLAIAKLYDFVWSDYCDWYIELTKPMLYSQDESKKRGALAVLKYVLADILKLLHPFVPFITEEIWSQLGLSETIMLESYPKFNEKLVFAKESTDFESVKEVISKIRNIRAEMNIPFTKRFNLYIKTAQKDVFSPSLVYIEKLAGVTGVHFVSDKREAGEKLAQSATANAEIYIPLGELVDFDKEKERLGKELKRVTDEISRGENMLKNSGFVAKAPQSLIEQEKAKLQVNYDLKTKIEKQLVDL